MMGFHGFPAQVCLIGSVLYGDNVVVKCLRVENARPLAGTLVWDGVSLLEYQAGTPGSFLYILKSFLVKIELKLSFKLKTYQLNFHISTWIFQKSCGQVKS